MTASSYQLLLPTLMPNLIRYYMSSTRRGPGWIQRKIKLIFLPQVAYGVVGETNENKTKTRENQTVLEPSQGPRRDMGLSASHLTTMPGRTLHS